MPRSSFLVEGVLTKLCRICIIPEEPALSGLKDWEIRRLEGSKAGKLKSSKAQNMGLARAQNRSTANRERAPSEIRFEEHQVQAAVVTS
jgi:hypothetical protein